MSENRHIPSSSRTYLAHGRFCVLTTANPTLPRSLSLEHHRAISDPLETPSSGCVHGPRQHPGRVVALIAPTVLVRTRKPYHASRPRFRSAALNARHRLNDARWAKQVKHSKQQLHFGGAPGAPPNRYDRPKPRKIRKDNTQNAEKHSRNPPNPSRARGGGRCRCRQSNAIRAAQENRAYLCLNFREHSRRRFLALLQKPPLLKGSQCRSILSCSALWSPSSGR